MNFVGLRSAGSFGSISTCVMIVATLRGLPARALALRRSESVRLWESPGIFGMVVGVLSLEWVWRRRRGLP